MFARAMKLLLPAIALLIMNTNTPAESRFDLQAGDTVQKILTQQTGQLVDLRLKSGEKIGGKIEKIGDKLVHLSQLTGAEFFEAVVVIDDISAVVVRAKGK
jgi:hypothetical protein